jgi:hypothetical protein
VVCVCCCCFGCVAHSVAYAAGKRHASKQARKHPRCSGTQLTPQHFKVRTFISSSSSGGLPAVAWAHTASVGVTYAYWEHRCGGSTALQLQNHQRLIVLLCSMHTCTAICQSICRSQLLHACGQASAAASCCMPVAKQQPQPVAACLWPSSCRNWQ